MPDRSTELTALVGRRFALRPIHPSDRDFLYAIELGAPHAHRWRWRGRTPSPDAHFESLFDGVLATFLAVERRNGASAGLVFAYKADTHNGHAYVAALAAPKYQQRGMFLEVVALFLRYCFSLWSLRKVYFETAEWNLPQFLRVPRSLLREEGRLREHDFYDGRYWDRVTLALYRRDWERVAPLVLGSDSGTDIARPDTFEHFTRLLRDLLELPDDLEIDTDSRLRDDLAIDSLGLFTIVVLLDTLLDETLPDELVPALITVGDLYDHYSRRRDDAG